MEIKNKITDEYENYLDKLNQYSSKISILDSNTTETRLGSIMTFSLPFYLVEGLAVVIAGNCMKNGFPIPSTILPGLIISTSLIGGIIADEIADNKSKYKNKIENISHAESDKEYELDLAEKKLEVKKLLYRMAVFEPTLKTDSYNGEVPKEEDLPKRYEELKRIISDKLHDLDTLVTREYLYDLHNTYGNPIKHYVEIPLAIAGTLMVASATPLIAGLQPITMLSNLVIPLIVGEVCGLGYQIDKAVRRHDVFKAINASLGTNAITKEDFKKFKELTKENNSYYFYDIVHNKIAEIQNLVLEAQYIEQQNSVSDDDIVEQEEIKETKTYTETVYYTTDNQKEVGLHLKHNKTNH